MHNAWIVYCIAELCAWWKLAQPLEVWDHVTCFWQHWTAVVNDGPAQVLCVIWPFSPNPESLSSAAEIRDADQQKTFCSRLQYICTPKQLFLVKRDLHVYLFTFLHKNFITIHWRLIVRVQKVYTNTDHDQIIKVKVIVWLLKCKVL